MVTVSTMVSSMHCCTSRWTDPPPLARRLARAAWAWCVLLALLCPTWAASQVSQDAGGALQLRVQRSAQGLFLSTTVPLQLPRPVEDALLKGIAMHFVAEAQVLHHRWYWSDKILARATRYLRLSYQPLTRRWRVTQAPEPIAPGGLGIALAQNYDTLQDALAAMGRISAWHVARASELEEDTPDTLRLRYRLDTSQLPRPLQWGSVGGANWSLQLEGTSTVPGFETEAGQAQPEIPPQQQ